jgi:hypothetical protein
LPKHHLPSLSILPPPPPSIPPHLPHQRMVVEARTSLPRKQQSVEFVGEIDHWIGRAGGEAVFDCGGVRIWERRAPCLVPGRFRWFCGQTNQYTVGTSVPGRDQSLRSGCGISVRPSSDHRGASDWIGTDASHAFM